ncbi:MAG: hypothetical protein KIH65_001910 [Candidatus Uhrbacteria bacterium]|nr:hypothetical protein [Candidatus Uhrbacteria bacterium]
MNERPSFHDLPAVEDPSKALAKKLDTFGRNFFDTRLDFNESQLSGEDLMRQQIGEIQSRITQLEGRDIGEQERLESQIGIIRSGMDAVRTNKRPDPEYFAYLQELEDRIVQAYERAKQDAEAEPENEEKQRILASTEMFLNSIRGYQNRPVLRKDDLVA